MKRITLLVLACLLSITGCEGKKKDVDVNAPGVNVKVGDGGVNVETPNTKVDVDKK